MDYIATFIEKYIDFTYALMRYGLLLWLTINIFDERYLRIAAVVSVLIVLLATPAFVKEGRKK